MKAQLLPAGLGLDRLTSIFSGRTLLFRYVPHHEVDASLRLGWVPTAVLGGLHHGEWSAMMAWGFCACAMPLPAREGA